MRILVACGLLCVIGCAKERDSGFTSLNVDMNYSVDELVGRLKNESREDRLQAAQGLKKKGADAQAAAPALAAALKDSDKGVREAAAEALAAIGPEGRAQGVAACLALLDAADEAGRQQGRELLALVSPNSLKVLELKDADKRRDVATALVKEPDLVDVVPMLLELRKQAGDKKDADLLQLVDYVLKHGHLDKAETVPALITALKNDDPHVRAGTLLLLDRLGKKAAPVLPALTERMKTADRKAYEEYLLVYQKISGWGGYTFAPNDPAASKIKLEVLSSEQILGKLAAEKDKIVVVDVWASWCPPCRREFPNLLILSREFAGKGVLCLSVSIDEAGQHEEALTFLREKGSTITNYRVSDGDAWSDKFDIKFIPTILVFQQGKLLKKFNNYEELKPFLREVLDKKSS